jgi:hypothetical protein
MNVTEAIRDSVLSLRRSEAGMQNHMERTDAVFNGAIDEAVKKIDAIIYEQGEKLSQGGKNV